MPFSMKRRSFLKGIGGTVVGLPFLEAMLPWMKQAHAQSNFPKRYIVCFGGQSLGSDNDPVHNYYVPDTVGPNYDLKTALAPFANHGNIKNEISVVSGLKIPTANGGPVPSGGRSDDFHINSLSPLLSGVRSGPLRVNGVTSDQLVANEIAGSTTFKSLVFRVQAAWYLNTGSPSGRDLISYRRSTSGSLQAIPATVSPRAAFDALFAGFMPPDAGGAAERAFLLKQRKSVLDLVAADTERLAQKLGSADRARLSRHLDEIRDLERRIEAIPPETQGACAMPADPGEDPPLGGSQGSAGGSDFNVNAGYSDEDTRARTFCDLIHMAMVCDSTRVASLQFTMAQSHMNAHPITGIPYDIHELGHSGSAGGTMGMSKAIAWHMKHFAYLVAKFRDTPEGGGNMLHNAAMVFVHEGGHGYDPSSGKQYSSHCTDNMAAVIAGRAGGLVPGRHVVAADKHPAHVLASAMHAVGVPSNGLGEVQGILPELFTS